MNRPPHRQTTALFAAPMDRRAALQSLAATAAVIASPAILRSPAAAAEPAAAAAFTLPPLGYAYEALEPHIDAQTMKLHHSAHHNAFITNLNGLVDKYPELKSRPMADILGNLASVPEAVRTPVRNNLGGHFNHSFFWQLMTPGGAKAPSGNLKTAIDGSFGDLTKMTELMDKAALGRFGSGWAWLGVKDKKLVIFSTANQDPPHTEGAMPVIGVDVWEHAYYLKHQNRRGEYLKSWWNTVNWDRAAESFKAATA